MSLRELQDAVAQLVCDRRSLEGYAQDPTAWVRARVPTPDGRVLLGLDVEDVTAFHEIHARDRAYFLEATLPLTLQRLGGDWPGPYFAVEPFGHEDVRVEAQRFAAYVEQEAPDIGTPALARFELAKLLLLDAPPFAPPESFEMRMPAHPQLAGGLALVPADAHLPSLVDDPLSDAVPVTGAALLRRDADGIVTSWIEGAAATLLTAIATGDTTGILRLLREDDDARRALVQAIGDGVVG